jgi:hypothetical protein
MADKGKRTKKTDSTKRRATEKTAPIAQASKKVRVIEEGSPEQESDWGAVGTSTREREEYRHSGTPLGSDPRE